MSLTGALQIGRSGLAAHQAALEVTGNNLANAATEGYTRQIAGLIPAGGIESNPGMFVGMGVKLERIIRATDEALLTRVRTAVSNQEAALEQDKLLSQIEAIHSEFSDHGMSTRLNEFFNAWSNLSGTPGDTALRSLVMQQGQSLSDYITSVHSDLVTLRGQIDESVRGDVVAVNKILNEISQLNTEIVSAERGFGAANSLRDQRDQLIKQVSEYIDISTVEQESGTVDVFVGSIPVVIASGSRGMRVDFQAVDGELKLRLRVDADGSNLTATSGKIGQLLVSREADINSAVEALDEFAKQLIYQVNRVHSQGQGTQYFSSVTGSYGVDDTTTALSLADTGLTFLPGHGSFQLHVTQTSTDARTTSQINIDMDGIGGSDMSLDDLIAVIDAVAGVSAGVTTDGKLQITSDSPDFKFSFSDDSSGILASLGVNTFFAGTGSLDMTVNQTVKDNSALIASGQGHIAGDNGTALAMIQLQDQPVAALNGQSLRDYWARHVEDIAVKSSAAHGQVQATGLVLESLEAQRQGISGVSIDEEAINLLTFQRAYQGSARFISVIDELMTTLLSLVR